jgi:hypothetical protein
VVFLSNWEKLDTNESLVYCFAFLIFDKIQAALLFLFTGTSLQISLKYSADKSSILKASSCSSKFFFATSVVISSSVSGAGFVATANLAFNSSISLFFSDNNSFNLSSTTSASFTTRV